VVDHDSRPNNRLGFSAELAAASLGDLDLVSFQTSPMECVHTQQHAARAHDQYLICRQLSGSLRVEHNGRDATLEPGDMTLLDPYLPYVGSFSVDSRLLVLKVPRRGITARIGLATDIMARPVRATPGLGRLTSEFLSLLAGHADGLGPAASAVANQALDLFAATVAKTLGASQPRLSSARMVVLTQLRGIIEQRLTEPDLTPQLVARATGVSVRYANAVLAEEDTSLAQLIQIRRLERCRQALIDPAQAQRPISDIARRWGFADMTHFARRFRRAYGALPSAYRALQGRFG
jgi:AraC family transcriptional regulator, positive regulator of tynA and feaB